MHSSATTGEKNPKPPSSSTITRFFVSLAILSSKVDFACFDKLLGAVFLTEVFPYCCGSVFTLLLFFCVCHYRCLQRQKSFICVNLCKGPKHQIDSFVVTCQNDQRKEAKLQMSLLLKIRNKVPCCPTHFDWSCFCFHNGACLCSGSNIW